MFGSKSHEPPPAPPRRQVEDTSLEARLRALGYLLDQRGYLSEGLCILEVADGFEVNAIRVPEYAASTALVQQTENVEAERIAAAIAELRAIGG